MADAESKKPQEGRSDARKQGDNFVAKLVPDPAKPPDLIRLTGYRGASNQEGSVRLYGNAELSIYWDIPEGDVLYEQPVPSDADPLGAVTLWIKRDSKIVSNQSQQAQGGQQSMYTYPPTVTGAAPQAANIQWTAPITHTINHTIHTITPLCHSPYYFCPPHSDFVACPPSPLVICQVSPLPFCAQPISPTCPPTQTPPTLPTATIQTGSPVAGGLQAAAPQGFTPPTFPTQTFPTQTFPTQTLPTHTLPQSIIQYCTIPSPGIICAHPSIFVHCTIPVSLLCTHSPTPVCVIQASPNCPITQTPAPTTIPTSDPGSPVAGGVFAGGAQAAAPQAISPQFGVGGQAQIASPAVFCLRPSPLIFQCTIPHSLVYWQCVPHLTQTPICQVSPFCTPGQLTITQTIPTTIQTGSPVAQGGFQAAAQGAGPQAFTFTPVTLPTHGTIQTLPTPQTINVTFGQTVHPTIPTIPTNQTHPTIPTIPTIQTHPTFTVTFTPVTF